MEKLMTARLRMITLGFLGTACAGLLAAGPAAARTSLAGIEATLDTLVGLLSNAEPVNVGVFRSIDSTGDGNRSTTEVYVVPPGKILVVDHASVYLDVVVANRPATPLRIRAELRGPSPGIGFVTVPLGFMEEYAMTSRGTPNFLTSRNVSTYFGAGAISCTAETNYGGVNLRFGAQQCTLSGRLIDAP